MHSPRKLLSHTTYVIELIFDYLVSGAQLPRHREPSTYRAPFGRTFPRHHPIHIVAGEQHCRTSG